MQLVMDKRQCNGSESYVRIIHKDVLANGSGMKDTTKLLGCIRCIVKTLIKMDQGGYGYSSVSLDKNDYTGKPIINFKHKDIYPSYRYMIDTLNILHDLEWIKFNKVDQLPFKEYMQRIENYESGLIKLHPHERMSSIKRGKKWKNLSKKSSVETKQVKHEQAVIEIRKEGKPIPVPDTWQARGIIGQVNFINDWYEKNVNITYDGIRLHLRFKRIFKETLELGGRFYSDKGILQSYSKSVRHDIAINGSPVCEFDYVACQYRIIAEMAGVQLGEYFDPYSIDITGDRITDRKIGKLASTIMINTGSRRAAIMSLSNNLKKIGAEDVKPSGIIDKIIQRNDYAKDYFFTKSGDHLQHIDSNICNYMMLYSVLTSKPIFPIHDSFLCRVEDKDAIASFMLLSWRNVLKSYDNCLIREEEV